MKPLLILATALSVVGLVLVGRAAASPEAANVTGTLTDSVLLAALGTNDDLFATEDLSAVLDPMGTPTQHYGPFPSGSPDSGTCGNDWAEDMFNRIFTVRTASDGSITVVEQFKDGSFVTNAGPSPAGCDVTYTNHGTFIQSGTTGSMHGYFIIPLPPGTFQTSSSPHCDAVLMTDTDCTTATFIETHFNVTAYDVTTFFFHYAAGDQALLFQEWKNASADRGGNSGDIASF